MSGLPAHLRRDGDGWRIEVLVAPRAARPGVGPVHGGRLKLAVSAPPVDGAANAAVIELLADALGIARGQLAVVRGASSRRKSVRVVGVEQAALEALGR